jgi:hypothetical protein
MRKRHNADERFPRLYLFAMRIGDGSRYLPHSVRLSGFGARLPQAQTISQEAELHGTRGLA